MSKLQIKLYILIKIPILVPKSSGLAGVTEASAFLDNG
jgi:hypothetical protein